MDKYYIYIEWKDGDITEGYYFAKDKQDAVKKVLEGCDRDEIFDISVFKQIKNIKW